MKNVYIVDKQVEDMLAWADSSERGEVSFEDYSAIIRAGCSSEHVLYAGREFVRPGRKASTSADEPLGGATEFGGAEQPHT